jgi:hypothetical protein
MNYHQAWNHEVRRWLGVQSEPPCARADITERFSKSALATLEHHQKKRAIVERAMTELAALGVPPIVIKAEDAAEIRENIEQWKHADGYLIDQLCFAEGIMF